MDIYKLIMHTKDYYKELGIPRNALKSEIKSAYRSLASDTNLPNYVFEGPGEILAVKEDYAQVRWRRPVPDVWFKLEQLKEYSENSI